MSLGKLPGIKGLVSASQGKRRFKSDLSVDMISTPMADFRHTMHVGRGGEVFGDTSFLSNHGGNKGKGGNGEPGSPDSASSSKTTRFFARTFRNVRKNAPEPRPRADSRNLSPPPPPVSPIIKNAISLPQLNVEPSNGCLQRVLFPSAASSPDDSLYLYGLQSGFVTLPRLSRLERQFQDGDVRLERQFQDGDVRLERQFQDGDVRRGSLPHSGGITLTRSDSFTSFTLDFGPSLMSEVLELLDNPGCLHMAAHSWEEEEEEAGDKEEEEEEEGGSSVMEISTESPAMSSPDASVSSTLFGGGDANDATVGSEWAEQEKDRRSQKTADASMGSPQRAEPVMEAERFQRAADVLSRHYGGGSIAVSPSFSRDHKAQHTFSEEEEEIKV